MNTLKVFLVPFTKDNVALTYEWVSNPELRHMFLMYSEPTWIGHQLYFEKVLTNPTQHVYAILVEDVHVGNCGLKNISLSKKEGELWIYIGDASMRGKGIGKYATELLLGKGFDIFSFEMIYLHVAEFNIVAWKLYKQLGFIEFPLLKDVNEWKSHETKVLRMELRKALL